MEKEAVNKAELIQALSAYYDGSKSEAAKALNAVVETITYKTAAGEKVSITGFGVFEKVHRSARMVRNPRTGERKRAKATAVPRFRAGTDLKAYVSGAKKVPRATAKKATSGSAAASKATAATRKTVAKAPARKTTAKKTTAKR
jgi:DNA-binding protein HU-beta